MSSAGAVSAGARTSTASSVRSPLASVRRWNGAPNVAGVSGPLGAPTSPRRSTAMKANRRTPTNPTASTSTSTRNFVNRRRISPPGAGPADHPEPDGGYHRPILLRQEPPEEVDLAMVRARREHDHRRPPRPRDVEAHRAARHAHRTRARRALRRRAEARGALLDGRRHGARV